MKRISSFCEKAGFSRKEEIFISVCVLSIQIAGLFFADHVTQCLFNHSPLLEQVMNRLVFEVVHRALAEE